jgi:hypothetical protein
MPGRELLFFVFSTLAITFKHKIERNEKITTKRAFEKHLLPAARNLYGEDYFCIQQDGAPSHTAKIVQKWCEGNLPDFIPMDEWPRRSSDPLTCYI